MAAQQQMMGDQQKLMDEVICAIKACLNSVKGEIPMETLHKDYRELEGKPIPYRELHHATLASFLQSVPEVIQLRNRGGQLFASLVRKAGAADHIGQMVDRQKTTKKTAKGPTEAGTSPQKAICLGTSIRCTQCFFYQKDRAVLARAFQALSWS